jgi:hypothetical protein
MAVRAHYDANGARFRMRCKEGVIITFTSSGLREAGWLHPWETYRIRASWSERYLCGLIREYPGVSCIKNANTARIISSVMITTFGCMTRIELLRDQALPAPLGAKVSELSITTSIHRLASILEVGASRAVGLLVQYLPSGYRRCRLALGHLIQKVTLS